MPSEEVLTALEDLHKEMDRMQPVVKQVEIVQGLIDQVTELPDHYFKLIKEIKGQEEAFKKQLSSELSTHAEHLRQDVSQINKQSAEVNKSLSEHQKNLAVHDENLAVTREGLQNYLNSMVSMQIGERLDHLLKTSELKFEKLDATASAIQLGVQNIQGRIDLLESNISNRIREEGERTHAVLQQIDVAIASSNKKAKVLSIITWLLIIAGVTLILFLKK